VALALAGWRDAHPVEFGDRHPRRGDAALLGPAGTDGDESARRHQRAVERPGGSGDGPVTGTVAAARIALPAGPRIDPDDEGTAGVDVRRRRSSVPGTSSGSVPAARSARSWSRHTAARSRPSYGRKRRSLTCRVQASTARSPASHRWEYVSPQVQAAYAWTTAPSA